MFKRCLVLVLVAGFLNRANAQVSLSVQEPPAGIVQSSQLWNLTLIYSGTGSVQVYVGLSLVDLRDNQPVLRAFTRPVTLTKGAKMLKAVDITPIDYNYMSPALSRLGDAFLPVGSYRACYTIFNGQGKEGEMLTEDCIPIEVMPLNPPQLTMPADEAVLQTSYPQFSWLPPVPVTLFNDLNYELLLTEVRTDQNPMAAIQENLPVYHIRRLTGMVNNYPASGKSLDTGRVYAWRVIAKNGESFAGQSEVWTFKISKDKPAPLAPAGGKYLELKTDNGITNTAIIPDDILGIKFYSYDKTHETVIRFLNANKEVVKEMTRTLEYGNNFLVFRLDQVFAKETTYYIEIGDLQGTRYRSSFRMSN